MSDSQTQVLTIDGMHCDACVHALGALPGVRVSSVNIGEAKVMATPECKDRIQKGIEDAGYTLKEMHGQR